MLGNSRAILGPGGRLAQVRGVIRPPYRNDVPSRQSTQVAHGQRLAEPRPRPLPPAGLRGQRALRPDMRAHVAALVIPGLVQAKIEALDGDRVSCRLRLAKAAKDIDKATERYVDQKIRRHARIYFLASQRDLGRH